MAGTATGDEAVAVAKVQVDLIVEMILSTWVVASKCAGAVNAWLRIGGTERERVG